MNPSPSKRRLHTWTVVILFVATLASRIPFRSQILYHWDSVNFAYAMSEFSVAKEQPQPPGYIVYVWLCRAVDRLFGDAQTTMVWISVVASALAVVALYYLGRAMFDARAGLVAALFLATSPLFWFYGEIALPHSLDMLLVILGVWWLYETMQGKRRYLFPAIAVMAVAGGVRQQTLVFLAPLILFALRKVGWQRFIVAGGLGGIICLAWFAPLMALNGGASGYFEAMGAFTDRFNATTSVLAGGGWWGVQRNLIKLTLYTLFGWSVALLPFAAALITRARKRDWPRQWEKVILFALWLLPTLVFYTVIHMGQQGLTFVFLPALLLWGARALVRLFENGPRQRLATVTAALLAVNIGIFCFAPQYPLPTDRVRLLTRSALVETDRYYADRFAAIEASLAPESTAILAANWHHVEYYLPRYTLLPMDVIAKWELGEGQPTGRLRGVSVTPADLGLQPDLDGRHTIVIFDPDLEPFNQSLSSTHRLTLEHGAEMTFLVWTDGLVLNYGDRSFGLSEP